MTLPSFLFAGYSGISGTLRYSGGIGGWWTHEPCVPMDEKECWFVSVFFGEGCLKVRLSYEEGCCRVAVWVEVVTLWQRFWCGPIFENEE